MRSKGILYKTEAQLRSMIAPGIATRLGLEAAAAAVKAGVTPLELDAIAEKAIRDFGGEPNFKLVPGYSHTLCTSVNANVVHSIPTDEKLQAGDMISIDCGAIIDGWNADAAVTVVVPDPNRPALVAAREKLSEVTKNAMWAGIAALAKGKYLNEVGTAIEKYIHENSDYGILAEYIGHGIGRDMHEEPPVFNYEVHNRGPQIKAGLAVAIEPIISAGSPVSFTQPDGWTVTMKDGKDSCQWEHTVLVHNKGIWVSTAADGGAAGLAAYGVEPRPLS
ncbi:MAG: type I methionyl aminopeptidase [Microbacteriaceae bacterium]|nr:type I methionyl aminopeptidase [Microbacteriaceae bacterium]